MRTLLRFAPLALVALPLFGHAQLRASSAVGLEIPASPAPASGHWLTGAYVTGNYAPVLAPGLAGYGVQPYLRYVLGSGQRARPFVQYSFAPYQVRPPYGSAAPFGSTNGLFGNLAFAPLASRNVPYGFHDGYDSYRSLGGFSVGVPTRIGRSPAVVTVGGSVLEGLLKAALR